MLYEYDATDERCPLPLVKTRLILKKMTSDDELILQIADEGSKTDIPKLLTKQGYRFVQKHLLGKVVELHISHAT